MSDTELDVSQIKSRRIGYLAFSTAVLLFLGLIYAFSMFARPMTEDFGIKEGIAITFNIMMIAFCIGAVIGSFVAKRLGIRASLILAAVMFAIGFIGAGQLASATGDVAMLYLFYGIIGGLGVGIGYNTIISTTNNWFPDKVGFSSGVLLIGFGMSSLIFGNIALMFRAALGGMSMVLTVLGVLVCILTIALAFVLKLPPANIVEVMVPASTEKKAVGPKVNEDENIFKTPIFYMYFIWTIVIIAIGLATIGNCAADAERVGVDLAFATFLVGLVSTANGISRILIGMLFDRAGIIITMLVDCLIAVAATACIVGAFALSLPALYIPGALLCGCAYGGVPVISSAFARQRFGAKKYPFNLSVINLAIAFGSFLNIAIGAAVGVDNRMTIFLVMMALSLISLADVFVFARKWKSDLAKIGKGN